MQVLHYKAYRALIANNRSYLYESGWMKSLEAGRPVDLSGESMPWMNIPIVNFIKNRLSLKIKLFEYGSGHSTLFFANRVNRVVSVEYNQNWFNSIQKLAPANVKLIYKAKDIDGDYCRTISDEVPEKFNAIIIDGRDRVNCAKQSVNAVSDDGIIILDDSQREKYQEAFEFLHSRGFRSMSISEIKFTDSENHQSTIFYRNDNCFNI